MDVYIQNLPYCTIDVLAREWCVSQIGSVPHNRWEIWMGHHDPRRLRNINLSCYTKALIFQLAQMGLPSWDRNPRSHVNLPFLHAVADCFCAQRHQTPRRIPAFHTKNRFQKVRLNAGHTWPSKPCIFLQTFIRPQSHRSPSVPLSAFSALQLAVREYPSFLSSTCDISDLHLLSWE